MSELFPGSIRPDEELIAINLDGEHYPELTTSTANMPDPNYVIESGSEE